MSASWGLVRFKKTGNIYYCCYDGTSDLLHPYICTPEECYDEKWDCYDAISYCRNLTRQKGTWCFPRNVADLDEVEIYSDYGNGFYWSGTGSESIKMIDDFVDPWRTSGVHITDGKPEWVLKFLISQE